MMKHSGVNALSTVMFKRSITEYIRRVTTRDNGMVHTGIVQEVVNSGGSLVNIVIEITDVEGSPHLSWTDSHFIIQEGNVFAVDDPVLLLPARGRFLIIKIEDDFTAVEVNRGTGSMLSGSTSDVITHGLSAAPAAEDINIVFTENPTVDPGNIWISAIGATTFTVNCRTNPGGSNLDFSWKADIR